MCVLTQDKYFPDWLFVKWEIEGLRLVAGFYETIWLELSLIHWFTYLLFSYFFYEGEQVWPRRKPRIRSRLSATLTTLLLMNHKQEKSFFINDNEDPNLKRIQPTTSPNTLAFCTWFDLPSHFDFTEVSNTDIYLQKIFKIQYILTYVDMLELFTYFSCFYKWIEHYWSYVQWYIMVYSHIKFIMHTLKCMEWLLKLSYQMILI